MTSKHLNHTPIITLHTSSSGSNRQHSPIRALYTARTVKNSYCSAISAHNFSLHSVLHVHRYQ